MLEQKVPWLVPDTSAYDEEAVSKVMSSKWLGMGPKTRVIEQSFCSYENVRNAVVVNNGKSAIASLIANDIDKLCSIGSDIGRIGELATTVDKDTHINDLQNQVLGSNQLIADNSKLRALGWQRGGLQDALQEVIEY